MCRIFYFFLKKNRECLSFCLHIHSSAFAPRTACCGSGWTCSSRSQATWRTGQLKRIPPKKQHFAQKKSLFPCFFSRLIQGQVTRAEVEEHTFAIKRELAAVKQHDLVIEKTTFRFYYYGTEAATMNRIFYIGFPIWNPRKKYFSC